MLTRKSRRQIAEASRPAWPIWRVAGALPIVTLALLMVVRGTFAWFTDSAQITGNSFSSGTFASLVRVVGAQPLYFSGNQGANYSGSFQVENLSTAVLSMSAEWVGTAPPGANLVSPATFTLQPAGQAGDKVTVTVSGSHTDSFTQNVALIIGNGFDSGDVQVVNVTVVTQPITNVLSVAKLGANGVFTGGQNVTLVENALEITPMSGMSLSSLTVVTSPNASPQLITDPATGKAYVQLTYRVNTQNSPTNIQVTISSSNPNILGSITKCVVFAHSNYNNIGAPPCTDGEAAASGTSAPMVKTTQADEPIARLEDELTVEDELNAETEDETSDEESSEEPQADDQEERA